MVGTASRGRQRLGQPRCIVGARSVVHLPFDLRQGLVGRKRSAGFIVGRYVAEPGSLTRRTPSAPREPAAAAAGLGGAPAGGSRRGGSVCARGVREGRPRGSRTRLNFEGRTRPARSSPPRRPPPSPRGTLPGALRGGGGGRGGGRRRRPGGRRRTREAAPGASASRAAGREGEAEPRETGTRGARGTRPEAGASRGRGRRRAPCRSVR